MIKNNSIVINGYTILGELGKGGMAEVVLAEQQSLKRKVAIKILLNNEENDFNQRFINEAHLVASLHHRSIITIYDINQLVDGRHYIAMEYLSGGDLAQYHGLALPPVRALSITRQIAEGLQVVHNKGLVHRDIKPANILFRDAEHVVITDFGIAKSLQQNVELTQQGIMVGSPSYCSPEQAQCLPLDQRTDIYSLGVVLFEMLTGVNPFRADNYTQTVINHVQAAVPTLPKHLQQYQSILSQMLAKNPEARFENCHALIKAINEIKHDVVLIDNDTTVSLLAVDIPKQSFLQKKMIVVVAILLLVSLFFLPPIKRPIMISYYLYQADNRIANNQWLDESDDNAVAYYQKVTNIDPNNLAAKKGVENVAFLYQQKAQEAFTKGDVKQAINNIKIAIKLDPNNKEFTALLKTYSPKTQASRQTANPFKKLWEKIKQN